MKWPELYSKLKRWVAILAPVITLVGIFMATPLRTEFLEFFKSSHEFVQITILALMGAAILALGLWKAYDNVEIKSLKKERDKWENEYKTLRDDEKKRWELAENVWAKAPSFEKRSFVDSSDRRTKFISVVNFKGGTGKTTLAANLAAILSLLDQRPASNGEKLKVLIVDLDFQSSLSNMCVLPVDIDRQRKKKMTVERLIECQNDPQMLDQLGVAMRGIEGVDVIISTDLLLSADLKAEAEMLLKHEQDNSEPRFRFQSVFHSIKYPCKYDLVIFDCPPRLTASVVNGLACSDYVLIPTTLEGLSLDAVPRTMSWIKKMASSGVIVAPKMCVVLNKAKYYRGKLVNKQFQGLDQMKSNVAVFHVDYSILEGAGIPDFRDARDDPQKQDRVTVCHNKRVKNAFLKLAEDFRKMVRI